MKSATLSLSLSILTLAALAPGALANWPQFRGPTQNGQVPESQEPLPVAWSEERNVTWKTAIHGKAWSTPAVWGGRVWLSTATEDGKRMSAVCVDAATGEILHDKVVFENESVEPLGNPVNSYGSPSPAIDADHVYIHFGSYGTACLRRESGELVWQRRDLPCRHFRGPGSSVALYRDLVILTMDGVDVQYLVALDRATGETRWKTDRSTDFQDLDADGKPTAEGDLRKAYATPMVQRLGERDVLISSGAKSAFGYDAATGRELWWVTYAGFSNAASPVFARGAAIFNTGYSKAHLIAVDVDAGARGDLTGKIKWDILKRVPLRSSPVTSGDHLFMVTDNGVASCVSIADGELVWDQRLDGQFSGSPIIDHGRVYFCSEDGRTHVVEAKPEFKRLATNTLDEGMFASPAASDGALFLRTIGHLYRIDSD